MRMEGVMLRVYLGVLMMMVVGLAQGQTAQVSLSETSAQLKYGMLVGGQRFGRSELTAGFLYNSDSDYIAEAALLVVDEAGSKLPGMRIGLGGKFYGASIPNNELAALAIGGEVYYTLSRMDRLTLAAEGFYAPSIVSFLDTERFWEVAGRVQYAVLPTAEAFIEYRKFYAELDSGAGVSIDKGIRLGLRIEF